MFPFIWKELLPFGSKGPSGFSPTSTAEEATQGVDGSGLTAIVTGASSGIGTETARVLALRGVHVVMGVRNLSAGSDVKKAILKKIPSAKVDVLELDLSSMASVKQFVSEFGSLNLPLNILINNAGVVASPFSLSHDGLELQFATNHIGHFLLTNLLLNNMKSTSCKSGIEGRIVNVSSLGHKMIYPEGIRINNINDELGYDPWLAYGQTKLANILHANELSRRLKEENAKVTANSLHPGLIATNVMRHHSFKNAILRSLGRLVLKNVQQNLELGRYGMTKRPKLERLMVAVLYEALRGAATTCYVALNPQVEGVTGKYFSDSNLATPTSEATDSELATKLWDFSMSVTSAYVV